jgi:MoaA/NifB/PqqE/SkfB family radical SAM enzyme
MQDFAAEGTVIENERVIRWGKRSPHVLSVAVTYQCQCRCQHCSAENYRQKTQREGGMLTLEQLTDTIRQGIDIGATLLILSGGEPLLKPEIFELLARIDTRKCIPIIFTNGEFLTDDVISRLIKHGLHGVFVSIDSSVPEEHDQWRGRPGLFEMATDGIRRAVKAGLLVGVSTVATKDRVRNGDLERLMDVAKALRVMEVIVFDITPAGKMEGVGGILLEREDKNKIQELISFYNQSEEYPNMLHESMFSYFAAPCIQGCPGGSVLVHVRGNGDVAPCDGMPIPFGNIKNERFADIWNRISSHEEFSKNYQGCRLSNPAFVQKYLEGKSIFQ